LPESFPDGQGGLNLAAHTPQGRRQPGVDPEIHET
jgi:hypothetical protein